MLVMCTTTLVTRFVSFTSDSDLPGKGCMHVCIKMMFSIGLHGAVRKNRKLTVEQKGFPNNHDILYTLHAKILGMPFIFKTHVANRTSCRSETLNCLIVNHNVPNIFKCLNLGGSLCIVII